MTKNWLWLALCGVIDALIAAIYLLMRNADGPLTFGSWNVTVEFLGMLTMAAGLCAIGAGVWRSARGKSWLLVLHGLALGALGLIYYAFVRYAISFRTIALLIVLIALSIGILEWLVDGWFLRVAGVISVGFALGFTGLASHWIKIDPGSRSDLLWLGAYFVFSAICMLGLALRLHHQPQSPKNLSPGLRYL